MAMHETPIARIADVAVGTTKRVTVDGDAILLCNVAGTVYAIEDVCTHDGGELDASELEGCRIACPRHGAYFDVTTGAALTLPAIVPVRTYPVRIDGDTIYLDVS